MTLRKMFSKTHEIDIFSPVIFRLTFFGQSYPVLYLETNLRLPKAAANLT